MALYNIYPIYQLVIIADVLNDSFRNDVKYQYHKLELFI